MHDTPSSLSQLAEQTRGGLDFGYLRHFLDAFYRRPDPGALRDEPASLANFSLEGNLQDAYLASVAESLAARQGWPAPFWVFGAGRYLRRPYFSTQAASFRATLLLESPPEFRTRNIFVTANTLSRA